jgi:hypothetical protein
MKRRGTASAYVRDEAGRHGPTVNANGASSPRRRHLQLSPVAAICIATTVLILGIRSQADPFGFRLQAQHTTSPAEAADISLQRLMRTRVVQRLKREKRLNASLQQRQATIDDELARIRQHPLCIIIKDMMVDHLRNEGYDRVPLQRTQDPRALMLSMDAEADLYKWMHSLRASFRAPNEEVGTYLKECERIFGESIVVCRGPDYHEAAFTFLIQLLFEYPDDMEPVTDTVSFYARPREETERELYGKALD